MPFFFAERKVFNPRDYSAGAGMPLNRQEAHKALNLNGSREVNFGNCCRSLVDLDVIVLVHSAAQVVSIILPAQ